MAAVSQEPGMDDRTGGMPDSAPGLPVAPDVSTRDPRLAGFAKDGEWARARLRRC